MARKILNIVKIGIALFLLIIKLAKEGLLFIIYRFLAKKEFCRSLREAGVPEDIIKGLQRELPNLRMIGGDHKQFFSFRKTEGC